MRRLAALSCALALAIGATGMVATGSPAADPVLPIVGPWHATTSAGLPVEFDVVAGEVLDPRWRFKWGFCGSFENSARATVSIEADGHWKFTDSRGPWIEGTFVAPDRLEGTVTAPPRQLPGCPETQATFVAEPGATGSFEQAEAVVRSNVATRRLVHEPAAMRLRRDGSLRFYEIDWESFGEGAARGVGKAFLRQGCHRCRDKVVRRPKVVVYLNQLTQQGDHRVYLHLYYRFVGSIPPGFGRHGSRLLE
jgi:hypothetical protein